jgi:hypothetical protein
VSPSHYYVIRAAEPGAEVKTVSIPPSGEVSLVTTCHALRTDSGGFVNFVGSRAAVDANTVRSIPVDLPSGKLLAYEPGEPDQEADYFLHWSYVLVNPEIRTAPSDESVHDGKTPRR